MAIYELDGRKPDIAESAWVADSAQVMGAVDVGRWKPTFGLVW